MLNFASAMTNKRRIFLSVLLLLLIAVGVYGYSVWQLGHLNTSYRFMETKGNLICTFDVINDMNITQPSGNTVVFALGSRHSFISIDAAEHLKDKGFPVEFLNTLIYTTDENGIYRLYTKIARLDVTFVNPELPDSTFIIHDVELLVRPKGTPNILGIDILSNLVIERLYPENIVNLYKTVPAGYHTIAKIKVHNSPLGNYLGPAGRASIKLSVNDEAPRDYYFSTAGKMDDYEIVQPENNIVQATTEVKKDPRTGQLTQHNCRVSFGNRLRYSNVVYSDSIHANEYNVNPLRLFDQDFVLDMPGRRLMVHRTRE